MLKLCDNGSNIDFCMRQVRFWEKPRKPKFRVWPFGSVQVFKNRTEIRFPHIPSIESNGGPSTMEEDCRWCSHTSYRGWLKAVAVCSFTYCNIFCLYRCWSVNPVERPSMSEIVRVMTRLSKVLFYLLKFCCHSYRIVLLSWMLDIRWLGCRTNEWLI